ncbi:M28 family peptidase [Chryseobacterium caseinilyticum]|uniref:M28 family peptidase n=1 Tax=Chryseobacterium caseinilyticum TaxID=2771428 RepID=A0ABR8Z8H7_9FLAO|nr:M28 family peptidase [Chryseobacterium caseinilyticum]MBD8081609.1 M28 family peptidase [Chryseobacterium caseinilyticum]
MKKVLSVLSLGILGIFHGQTFIQAYQDRANQVTQTNITSLLQQFSNLGVKTTGSVENNNTLAWLKSQYLTYGYTASQMSEDTFTSGSNTSKNLIVTKTGTVYPNIFVIICGHYDTINSPGVSDNGSGTSILLEAARILKDVPTEYSVKFIHFSGEEQGLVGSTHYVNNVVFSNNVRQLNLKVVFNIDQVGGKMGNPNTTITCESDQSGQTANNAPSLAMTQQLANCTTLYSPLLVNMSNAFASDYVPFENKGDIITGFYETPVSGNQHTPNDTFANVDPVYVFKVGKAAVGALQHFAVASSVLAVDEAQKISDQIKIYPNPAKNILYIETPSSVKNFAVEISDMSGKLVLKSENQNEINISGISSGNYMCSISYNGEKISRKIIVE